MEENTCHVCTVSLSLSSGSLMLLSLLMVPDCAPWSLPRWCLVPRGLNLDFRFLLGIIYHCDLTKEELEPRVFREVTVKGIDASDYQTVQVRRRACSCWCELEALASGRAVPPAAGQELWR